MTPLTFAPDADPTTPGVIVEATNLIPSDKGYQDAPRPDNLTKDPFPESPVISMYAAMLHKINGDARIFAGIHTGLYERLSTGWTKRITASAGQWTMRQFGDATLAGSPANTIQASTSTTFSVVSGSPAPTTLCVTSTHQVMALGPTTQVDGWACSALGDHTNWTPDLATQAATNRFLATPGPVTGGIEFGPHIVAFKERSMYWMRYANVPLIWSTEVISNEVGTIAKNSVLDVGERILFIGPDDFYSFDGTKPVPIGGPVRRWFFSRLFRGYRSFIQGVYDGTTGCAWWFYPTTADTTIDLTHAVVYHVASGRWGHAEIKVGAPLILRESVLTGSDVYGAVYQAPHVLGALIDGDLYALRDRTGESVVRLGWFGDDLQTSTLTKLRPRFLEKPSVATAQFFSTDELAEETATKQASYDKGAFGTQQNAQWHSAELEMQGPFEISALGHDIPRQGGKR